MEHPFWPLFDLRLTTPRLQLRLATDDDLIALAGVARDGIHDPAVVPFAADWTSRPSPELERALAQYHWRCRADWTPAEWTLELAVVAGDEVIGVQALAATSFATIGSVGTGSRLGRRHQGQGLGTEMRAAGLELAFAGLGAEEAHSGARTDNHASLAVSRKLGYEPNGTRRVLRGSEVTTEQQVRLTRDRWASERPAYEITIEGLDQARALFGI
jgi:RimJ/RimL family protein N-acetyltransferase